MAFQSTRPRGARPPALAVWRGADVSIHAPTRGATRGALLDLLGDGVSIHAPTRGATRSSPRWPRRSSCFNPRAHAGRDPRRLLPPHPVGVSIHAPTRGATTPTSTAETRRCFNPRAHAGRDARGGVRAGRHGVSIHAPTRGATAGIVSCLPKRVQEEVSANHAK